MRSGSPARKAYGFLPAVGLALAAPALSLRRELSAHGRALAVAAGCFVAAALLPLLTVSTLNLRHYGWFGTVEFRAPEFGAAYGALTRIKVGPELDQVPVTRQMREAAYEISRPSPSCGHSSKVPWVNIGSSRTSFPVAERQIRGGWFVWAIRDAVREAGLAPDAGAAMRYYQAVADEVNAACEAGRVPARPRRSGFLPPLSAAYAGAAVRHHRRLRHLFRYVSRLQRVLPGKRRRLRRPQAISQHRRHAPEQRAALAGETPRPSRTGATSGR